MTEPTEDKSPDELDHAYAEAEMWRLRFERVKGWIKQRYEAGRDFRKRGFEMEDSLKVLMDAAHAVKNIERYDLARLRQDLLPRERPALVEGEEFPQSY